MIIDPNTEAYRDEAMKAAKGVGALIGWANSLAPMVSDLPVTECAPQVNANLVLAIRALEDAEFRLKRSVQMALR